MYTDNKAIVLIFKNSKSDPPARIKRFNLRLMDLKFEIRQKPGVKIIADYFSRNCIKSSESCAQTSFAEQFNFVAEINRQSAMPLDEIKEATIHDDVLQNVIKALRSQSSPDKPELKPYKLVKDELSEVENG